MPLSDMQAAAVVYLETYGQPQFAHSIQAYLTDNGHDASWLQAELDTMVADGTIKAVDGGVDSGGNAQTCYAPLSFNG